MFGNLRKAHLGALLAAFASLCLVVATAAAQAQASKTVGTLTCSKVGFATVCPTLNTVKVSFTTSKPTKASVSMSVDRSYALQVLDGKAKTKHAITIRSLAPATTYNIRVVTTPAKGRSVTASGSFSTGAIGSVPTTVTSSGGKLLLNGSPAFFELVTTGQPCPDQQTVDNFVGLGIKVINSTNSGSCQSWAATLHSVLQGRVWWRERDPNGYNQLSSSGLPELLNAQPGTLDRQMLVIEDVCGSTASKTYQAVKAAQKPVLFNTSLATSPIRPSQNGCLDASSLTMVFWTVVAAHASGINFGTQDAGGKAEYDVKTELQQTSVKLCGEMATISPAIETGKTLDLAVPADGAVQVGAWAYGGETYLVAVNTTDQASSLSVGNLGTGTAVALWGGRSIMLKNGSMTDQLEPQAVHIYRIQPSTKK